MANPPNLRALAAIPGPITDAAPMLNTSPLMAAAPGAGLVATPAPLPNVGVSQTLTDVDRLHALQSQGSGISHIQNPWLRGIARVADGVGQFIAPRVERLIPGSEGKYQSDIAQQANTVQQDQQRDLQTQQIDTAAAHERQQEALATQEQAKAQAILNPPAKPAPEHKQETLQQMHADAVQAALESGHDPATDPKVQRLSDAITSLQRQPAAKEPNKDDRYIAIQAKPKAQWTPEEASFVRGYDQYVEKNKIQPAGIRASVMMQMPQAVVDPNDPSRVVYTDRRHAMGMEAPGSGEAMAARANDKYFAGGGGGAQALTRFNTSQTHLDLLGQAAKALQNGNIEAFNRFSQGYAQATGSAAPTNFDAIKLAVRGEVAAALAGHATVAEQNDLDHNFSRASSPAQLAGVAQTYRNLLEGKKKALKDQYDAGKRGQANFSSSESQPVEEYVRVNGKLVKK